LIPASSSTTRAESTAEVVDETNLNEKPSLLIYQQRPGMSQVTVPVNGLPAGVYFIHVPCALHRYGHVVTLARILIQKNIYTDHSTEIIF
jgi:hypothetical protein